MTEFKHLSGPCKAIPTPANEIDAIDFDPRIVPQICDGLRRGYIDEEQVIIVIRYRRRLRRQARGTIPSHGCDEGQHPASQYFAHVLSHPPHMPLPSFHSLSTTPPSTL